MELSGIVEEFIRERFRGQVNYEIDKVIRCYRGGRSFCFCYFALTKWFKRKGRLGFYGQFVKYI